MWMNSLSTDESDSREEILISLLLDLANTQVSLTSDIELAAKNLPLPVVSLGLKSAPAIFSGITTVAR